MESTALFLLLLLRLISAAKYGCFSSEHGVRVVNVYQTVTFPRSKVACSQLCVTDSQCKSASFNNKTFSCELSVYHPADISSKLTVEDGWILMYKKNGLIDNWTVVFRGTARTGVNVIDSFLGTNSLPMPDIGCYSWDSIACNTHVRSSWIDKWKNLNIKEIKVEFLINGETVAYMIFQNRATDEKTTWFVPENLIQSSWTDLPLTNPNYALFQLERNTGPQDLRRSFVIYETLSGCTSSGGWMFVSEVDGSWYCNAYENENQRPVFLYSKGPTAQVWSSGPSMADVMLVSIKA